MYATTTAIFVLTLLLALYELDRQRYMTEKKEIITQNFYDIFRLPDELNQQAHDALFLPGEAPRTVALDRLTSTITGILDGPSSMYRFVLRDVDGQDLLLMERPGKLREFNTWRNNLFLRSFSGTSDLRISRRAQLPGEPRMAGRLIAHYTSPHDNPAIERLTVRYRWYAAGLAAVWSAIYYFVFIYLLRPVGRVTSHLDVARRGSVVLIPRAGGTLEKAYNEIASRAILQELGQILTAAPPTPEARSRAVSDGLDIVARAFGVHDLLLAEVAKGEDGLDVIECWPAGANRDEIAGRASVALGRPAASRPFSSDDQGAFEYIAELPTATVFVAGSLAAPLLNKSFRLRSMGRAAEILAQGIAAYRSLERTIARQRSEANMILSRNLGHDLTNIIATGKLDLMAVRQIVQENPGQPLDAQRRGVLAQSVDGVLRSTRFLQEIVNIYRSFSYIKRPAYERQSLNELVDEFLTVFEPTISSRIELRRELCPENASFIVEPRLLKLALFNVLANALDALKRSQPPVASPRVVVRTVARPSSGEFRIEIDDNGPGIRAPDGRLLGRGEIDAIFRHGYSTKSESSEGLGLNWVRTIIRDFHHGRVRAENLQGGGARFVLVIRSMESAEARIGHEEPGASPRPESQ